MFIHIGCGGDNKKFNDLAVKMFCKYFENNGMNGVKRGFIPFMREVFFEFKGFDVKESKILVPARTDDEAKEWFRNNCSRIYGEKFTSNKITMLFTGPVFCYVSSQEDCDKIGADMISKWEKDQ